MHIHFSIFGESFGQRLITQMYFEGDPLIKLCPMVNAIPDDKIKNSLIGKLDVSRAVSHNILAYKFDIILRGINQTYFENRKEGL
jgi:protocatechuate 3,4-dioxygenase beta subunit